VTRWVVSGDASIQDDVLESLSTADQYRRWICDLARPWLGPNPLEVGAGTGAYAAEWAAPDLQLTVTEADPTRVAALQRRFENHPHVRVRKLILPTEDYKRHSAVVAINVLEHIEDDRAALRSMTQMVRPGGNVALFVPAFPLAMSRFDRQVGHFRRYRRQEVQALLRQAGLDPQVVHYVNAPGLIAWFLLMRLGRSHPRDGIALRAFERCVPPLRRFESRWRPPFGQSIFAVGTTRWPSDER
jgi:ubiquinone/menaquinone biosynthesis C-methylase UbiE